MLETRRLILRGWTDADAGSLFEYASDPEIGPSAGWPAHRSVTESLETIRNVLSSAECYAVCGKIDGIAIGAAALKLSGHTDLTSRVDECELGYWLGKPFWGRGYITEAAGELLRHGFEELGMRAVWCGYYDGNERSRRVQEKLGFIHHHTRENVPLSLLNEIRTEQISVITKTRWEELWTCRSSRAAGDQEAYT